MRPWPLRGVVCLFALLTYSNSFGLELATDARMIVHLETRIRQLTLENLSLIFTHDYWWPSPADVLYRPVALLSYLFNYAVLENGESPFGYHLVNFLLHAANICLLFELASRLFRNRSAGFV